jgi:hypothetical protein
MPSRRCSNTASDFNGPEAPETLQGQMHRLCLLGQGARMNIAAAIAVLRAILRRRTAARMPDLPDASAASGRLAEAEALTPPPSRLPRRMQVIYK